jgi:predicted ribosome quality control (RQC) complex YloA/Tae2 family protein
VINSAMGAGLSWDDIGAMVATETAAGSTTLFAVILQPLTGFAGNPIASLVSKLRLDKNQVTLRFTVKEEDSSDESSEEEEEDSEEEEDEEARVKQPKKQRSKSTSSAVMVEIDIDLALSAHANANRLYTQKKVAHSKEEKTAMATERAVKAVEEQTAKQLESQKIKRNLQAVRKVHWFEKFNWFVTSEGYLVLSGRDAQQNEALVKRYLRPGDAYVHADIHGASSCIVRCKTDQDSRPIPISPFALQEAGTMTICRSGAWAVKVVTSAW